MSRTYTRRQFLTSAGLVSAGAIAFPAVMRSQGGGGSPNDRLNVAMIGVGGRARAGAMTGMKDQNFIAFCDVDDERAAPSFAKYPAVPRFRDYRTMLDKLGNQIDAVCITTPDHMHFPIAMTALSLGKHVFCEKPLVHTIEEARRIAVKARETKVATQMGNQGHASDGIRTLKEWVDAGVLGEVREVQSWTDRPGRWWPQGSLNNRPVDHSKFIPVVPPTLDWELWQGVAQPRPYDPAYLPFNWRGFWEYGTGALGDMGCHLLDAAHWALDLSEPTHLEAISGFATTITGPASSIVTFQFPARGKFAPLTLKWYDGGLIPPAPPGWDREQPLPDNGTLFIGTKATVFATLYNASVRIIPEAKMLEMMPGLPPPTIPRVPGGHFAEWIRACKGGPPPGSRFEAGARLTELCLLSNLAVRSGRPLRWDARAMQVTNFTPANRYLRKEYRPGFGV